MTTLNIEGRKVKVSDDFLRLSPAEQERTVEEIAASLNVQPARHPIMSQVNRGLADSIGGLVDLINPFDAQTGSAKTGIANAMEAGGVEVAQGDPQGFMQGMARGAGEGVGTMLPAAKALQVGQKAPGMIGAISQRLFPQTATKAGVATEALAAGIGRGTGEALEDAGAPEWVQRTAEIAAPAIALPALGASARGAVAVGSKAPGVSVARRGFQEIKRGVFPMTQEGAEEVAAERLRGLVGGEERAAQLGAGIEADNDLGLTPAQQTGDRNLLALEAQAARENPLVRERLDVRRAVTRQRAGEAIAGQGGDVADAKGFFAGRVAEVKKSLNQRAQRAAERAQGSLENIGPNRTETENSAKVVTEVKRELNLALAQENAFWSDIPKDAQVGTENAKMAAQNVVESSAFAQREDIPRAVQDILTKAEVYGDSATVRDMHGAYSKLRQVARTAMSGANQNKNTARVANEVAEAILKDLGAVDGKTVVGQQINEARAFSRALHETFDQGTVGKILNRSIDGDEAIPAEVALSRTVGRGGSTAKVSSEDIETAAPKSRDGISDYLRGKFSGAVQSASGAFTPKRAREWMRNNRELMQRYPEMRQEFAKAVANGDNAASFLARTEARLKLADTSAAAGFTKGKDGKAVLSIIGADNPAKAARAIVSTARKDPSGKALAGVKAAFADHLIAGATSKDGALSGKGVLALMKSQDMQSAMNQVFSAQEIGRLRQIALQLAKVDASSTADIGAVMDSPANKMVEMVVRIAAAKHGGNLGGGSMGGSIQTANIFTERARTMLRNLTNDRARQLLMDAVEDPELFKTLLRTPESVRLSNSAQSNLAPYLIGAVSAASSDD